VQQPGSMVQIALADDASWLALLDGIEHPAKPIAARRSWPRRSSKKLSDYLIWSSGCRVSASRETAP